MASVPFAQPDDERYGTLMSLLGGQGAAGGSSADKGTKSGAAAGSAAPPAEAAGFVNPGAYLDVNKNAGSNLAGAVINQTAPGLSQYEKDMETNATSAAEQAALDKAGGAHRMDPQGNYYSTYVLSPTGQWVDKPIAATGATAVGGQQYLDALGNLGTGNELTGIKGAGPLDQFLLNASPGGKQQMADYKSQNYDLLQNLIGGTWQAPEVQTTTIEKKKGGDIASRTMG